MWWRIQDGLRVVDFSREPLGSLDTSSSWFELNFDHTDTPFPHLPEPAEEKLGSEVDLRDFQCLELTLVLVDGGIYNEFLRIIVDLLEFTSNLLHLLLIENLKIWADFLGIENLN